MVLAEINFAVSSQRLYNKLASKIIGCLIVILGLIAMSYPRDLPERASWSYGLRELGEVVLPFNDSKYKPWVSLGCLVFILGIILSQPIQKALSIAPMVWLGKISFPLYLLHGTFIRSLFAWILFAGQELSPSARDENVLKYPLPSNIWIAFSVICLMLPLLISCHLWIKYLEPCFDQMTLWMESVMLKQTEPGQHRAWRLGWFARIKAMLQAILLVVRHGGLPARTCPDSYSVDLESENGFLLQETVADACSTSLLYASDINLKDTSPYRDSDNNEETERCLGKP